MTIIGPYKWIINENSFPLEILERIDEFIGKGSLIKESAIRRVVKLTPASSPFPEGFTLPLSPPFEGGEDRGGIFIKIYKKRGILRRLKTFLFKSKVFKEWEKIKKLSSLDIPTAYPLAFGQKKSSFLPEEECLITMAVDDAIPLNEYLSKVRSAICEVQSEDRQLSIVNRQFLIRTFSQFIGDIHKKGILNKDFHTGNILIRPYGSMLEPAFYLVDLDRISFRRRISFRKAIKNLITLNLCFLNTVSRADRLRFLKNYLQRTWPEKLQEYKIWSIGIERESKKLQKNHWGKRDKKCFKESSTILPITSPSRSSPSRGKVREGGSPIKGNRGKSESGKGYIRREFKYSELEKIIQDPNHAFQEAKVIKDSKSTKLVELETKRGEHEIKIVLKKYNFQWGMDVLKGFFRRSKAFKAWKGANALVRRGIPTPLPIAVLERRKMGVPLESFLITEKVEGAQGGLQFLQNLYFHSSLPRREGIRGSQGGEEESEKEAIKFKRLFLREMASFVAHFHSMGIYPGDLKGNNILVIPPNLPLIKGGKGGFSEEKEGFHFFLVDLDELKISKDYIFAKICSGLIYQAFVTVASFGHAQDKFMRQLMCDKSDRYSRMNPTSTEKMQRYSNETRKRLRNLTQLNKSFREIYLISRADRIRFLLKYLSSLGIDRKLYKWYWRKILEKSEKRLRKTGKQWERRFSSLSSAPLEM